MGGIFGDITGWFSNIVGFVTNPIQKFFESLAGQLAAGIEAAFVAIFKDIWKILVGPLEIIAGTLIAIVAFGLLFRDDIAGGFV